MGAHYIFRSGGIAELIRMLRCPVLPVINYAVTTLHHLLVYVPMAKEEAIACGALEALVPLLAPQTMIPQSGPNPKLQAMVCFLLLKSKRKKHVTFLLVNKRKEKICGLKVSSFLLLRTKALQLLGQPPTNSTTSVPIWLIN